MKKNVIIITTDQHRFDCIGANGNNVVKTPNIDRLANMGVNFQNHYCSAPTCSPARASILTGMYPRAHGLYALGYRMPEEQIEQNLASTLGRNGYDTAIIGKVHLAALEAREAENLNHADPYFGFRYYRVTEDDPCGEYLDWIKNEHPEYYEAALNNVCPSFAPKPYAHQAPEGKMEELYVSELPEELHQTAWITNHAIEYLDKAAEEKTPFFAWFSFVDPHHPWNPPAGYADLYDLEDIELPYLVQEELKGDDYKYAYIEGLDDLEYKKMTAAYYSLITFTDTYIGKIMDHLEEKGLMDNTVIVFTSDHGDYNGDHGLVRKCWRLYEGILRSPFIIVDPASTVKGKKVMGYTQDVDIMPTILDLCGIEYPREMQGKSLAHIFKGKEDTGRDYAVTEFTMSDHPFGDNKWSISIVKNGFKLLYYQFENRFYLYDLEKDPNEIHDLSAAEGYNEVLDGMKESLLEWNLKTGFYMRPQQYRW